MIFMSHWVENYIWSLEMLFRINEVQINEIWPSKMQSPGIIAVPKIQYPEWWITFYEILDASHFKQSWHKSKLILPTDFNIEIFFLIHVHDLKLMILSKAHLHRSVIDWSLSYFYVSTQKALWIEGHTTFTYNTTHVLSMGT